MDWYWIEGGGGRGGGGGGWGECKCVSEFLDFDGGGEWGEGRWGWGYEMVYRRHSEWYWKHRGVHFLVCVWVMGFIVYMNT